MDWKHEAIDKLKGYETRKQALSNIPDELSRLESTFEGIRGSVSGNTPVIGGGDGKEDAMLSNIVKRQELKLALKQARLWVKTVEGALSALDMEERKVLELLYIRRVKGNVDLLCEILGVEKAQVYRRRDKALRFFTIALYGVTES